MEQAKNEIITELKKLLPAMDRPGTKGGIIRSCLFDAMLKLITLRQGERMAELYRKSFSGDPLRGLESSHVAEELLCLIKARHVYLKPVPRVSTADLERWFMPKPGEMAS